MKRYQTPILLLCLILIPSTVVALVTRSGQGSWTGWPEELEFLRDDATTITGPFKCTVHDIPFSSRAEFEKAWPFFLKVMPAHSAIALESAPAPGWLQGDVLKAVVRYWEEGTVYENEGGLSKRDEGSPVISHLTLVVDGKVVDLNRIVFPRFVTLLDYRNPVE